MCNQLNDGHSFLFEHSGIVLTGAVSTKIYCRMSHKKEMVAGLLSALQKKEVLDLVTLRKFGR